MTEEATERLVKLYLESKGFFVRTNERIKVDDNKYPEIDIIAVRIKKDSEDNLPDKIIGEVKSWSLNLIHFPEEYCDEKHKRHKGKFKVFFEYRNKAEDVIKQKYGDGFKFIIFSRKLSNKNNEQIKIKLKQLDIEFIPLEEVAKDIVSYSKKRGYSNDPELQVLRLLDSAR